MKVFEIELVDAPEGWGTFGFRCRAATEDEALSKFGAAVEERLRREPSLPTPDLKMVQVYRISPQR